MPCPGEILQMQTSFLIGRVYDKSRLKMPGSRVPVSHCLKGNAEIDNIHFTEPD